MISTSRPPASMDNADQNSNLNSLMNPVEDPFPPAQMESMEPITDQQSG